MKYRVYVDNFTRAAAIVNTREEAESVCPKNRASIVKRFEGRRLYDEYLVSWLGDHFKWDPCFSDSDY